MAEENMTTEQDNPVEESTVLGSSESDNQDWRSGLPEELKNDSTLQNINDVESAAKTLIHQQKMMGNRIPIPKTDEEKAELYSKLGRPESADKYELNIPKEHNQFFPEANMNEFKNVAHQIGLNNDQANALIEFQLKSIEADMNNQGSRLALGKEETEAVLKQEWGLDYDRNFRAAQRALQVYGDPEIAELMNTEAGNNPAVVKLFARLGKEVTEDMAQNTQNNSLAVSPLDAKAEIEAVYADKKHAYHNATDPKHAEAVEKVRQLHEKVYG
tara:strand:+ start:6430 stop:7245 length:816 start_codon:yes stop_codon:yes gene_type:complete